MEMVRWIKLLLEKDDLSKLKLPDMRCVLPCHAGPVLEISGKIPSEKPNLSVLSFAFRVKNEPICVQSCLQTCARLLTNMSNNTSTPFLTTGY